MFIIYYSQNYFLKLKYYIKIAKYVIFIIIIFILNVYIFFLYISTLATQEL